MKKFSYIIFCLFMLLFSSCSNETVEISNIGIIYEIDDSFTPYFFVYFTSNGLEKKNSFSINVYNDILKWSSDCNQTSASMGVCNFSNPMIIPLTLNEPIEFNLDISHNNDKIKKTIKILNPLTALYDSYMKEQNRNNKQNIENDSTENDTENNITGDIENDNINNKEISNETEKEGAVADLNIETISEMFNKISCVFTAQISPVSTSRIAFNIKKFRTGSDVSYGYMDNNGVMMSSSTVFSSSFRSAFPQGAKKVILSERYFGDYVSVELYFVKRIML